MKITKLQDIDRERYRNVKTGKSTGRGCGKTFTVLITMFELNRRINCGKEYVVVLENHNMVEHCIDQFEWLLLDSHNPHYATEGNSIITIYSPLAIRGIWNKLVNFIKPIEQKLEHITFRFLSATEKFKRGSPPAAKVFLDVSPDTYEQNSKGISTIMSFQK